jgi:hypothetical protein
VTFVEIFVSLKFIKGAGNIIEDFVTPIYVYLPWTIVIFILSTYYIKLRYFSVPFNAKKKSLSPEKNGFTDEFLKEDSSLKKQKKKK